MDNSHCSSGRDGAPRRRTGVRTGQLVMSVLAAAFGVQSQAARERDFSRGHPAQFILGGIVFATLFVVVLTVIVRLVLASAGA